MSELDVHYGCHCDLEPGATPDGCVLDYDAPSDCIHAPSLVAAGKGREACHEWRPVTLSAGQGMTEAEGYLAEQCRLLGMGSSREARLTAQLAESQARELRLREALGDLRSGDGDPWCAEQQADSALALPFDDSALREMIEAAKAEEREACADLVEQRSQRSRTVRAAINGRQPEPCEYAAAIRARKG